MCIEHRGNTILATCAVDRAGTVQNDCRPRITAVDEVITVIGTIVYSCGRSWNGCRLPRSTAIFMRLVID